MDEGLVYAEETFRLRGAAFEVYRHLGPGFLEAVYQECLVRELRQRAIPFELQKRLTLFYKGEPLEQTYCADIICFDSIILELKGVRTLTPEHRAQLLNYLRGTGLRVGMLLNFGSAPKMQIERFAL